MNAVSKKLMNIGILFLCAATSVFAQDKISDPELNKFAVAFVEIQEINQRAQGEMVAVVEASGIAMDRFNQLYEASQNPNVPAPANVTPEETKNFKNAMSRMEAMQPVFMAEMEKSVTDEGLTLDRYQEMVVLLQADPALQQRLQVILEKQ